jgi:hypothetical protein
MPVFFNNCRCRDHVGLFGATAFYDLNTSGKQADMATNLKRGEICIVATYGDEREVVFGWFSLSHESLVPDPSEPGTKVRVFFGKKLKSVRLSKAKAAKSAPYSVFFNVLGNFKRPSVIKPIVTR